jgi:hypothetical protein
MNQASTEETLAEKETRAVDNLLKVAEGNWNNFQKYADKHDASDQYQACVRAGIKKAPIAYAIWTVGDATHCYCVKGSSRLDEKGVVLTAYFVPDWEAAKELWHECGDGADASVH